MGLLENFFRPIEERLDNLLALVQQLVKQGNKTMSTLSDITAAVAAETAVEASAITLLNGISAQLTAALAEDDPTQVQAVIDSINASSTSLAAAVAANTPAAPPTPPAPTA